MRCTALVAVVMVAALAIFSGAAGATNGKVLVVEDTVAGNAVPNPDPVGAGEGLAPSVSVEASAAILNGKGVTAVTAAELAGMSTADVAQYDAVILGDKKCATSMSATGITSLLGTSASPTKWGQAITGNVIVLGTDPVKSFFEGMAGGANMQTLFVIQGGIGFATAAADTAGTGAYIDLSCYYTSATSPAHVDVLDPFGNFSVRGAPCNNSAHQVATHPAFDAVGLRDVLFSEWWVCSARETFDSVPAGFLPVAIVNDPAGGPLPGSLSFADGSHGPAYIVARGSGLAPIPVTPANTAPIANADTYSTDQGVALTVAAPGVLGNDTDVDLNPLTAAQVSGPIHGMLTLNADGSFTYAPDAHFAGTDTFSYTANDGSLDSNIATATITVRDTEPPAITCPSNVTKPADVGQSSAVVTYSVTATDNAAGAVTISSNPASGTAFPVGTTTVHATATDAANNVSNCSFTVTVTLRPTALAYTGPSTATLGSATLTAKLTDSALAAGVAGKQVTFAIDGGAPQPAVTNAAGVASFTAGAPLALGPHSIAIRFAGDSTYSASTASGTLTIVTSNGGGSVKGDDVKPSTGGSVELDVKLQNDRGQHGNADIEGDFTYVFKSNRLESKRITALTVAADGSSAWFSGVARDGRTFVVYVEGGKVGKQPAPVLKLWIDGVLQTGGGALRDGRIKIKSS